jgi:hypothetical protein
MKSDAVKKIGIDDFLASPEGGPEKALELLEKAKPARVPVDKVALLDRLTEGVEFFRSGEMKLYAAVPVNGHREIWPLKSQTFRHWLAGQCYNLLHAVPRDIVRDALPVLEGRAAFEGQQYRVGMRVLRSGAAIYVDLVDEQWRVVEIAAAGWRVLGDAPAMFCRTRGMTALPLPLNGGGFADLREFLPHVNEEQWILIVAWLVGALRPEGPYVILILQGEQGSGKSTVARVLRALIDPSVAPLRTVAREERSLVITANNSWVIALDNLSRIPQWLSDALCRLSTGGGLSTRQLYTDDEEVLFDVRRPVILTGIEDLARSPDLGDRSMIVTLPALPDKDRQSEKIYWNRFEQARPRILGSLLGAVAAAHAHIDHTDIANPPRMADFVNWVAAATWDPAALPFSFCDFLKAYGDNRRDLVALSLEDSPLAAALKKMAGPECWTGTHTELLEKLNSTASENTQKFRSWPKNARALSSRLRKITPLLRAEGVVEITEIARDRDSNAKRLAVQLAQKRSDEEPGEEKNSTSH